jgi:hypothetical protein
MRIDIGVAIGVVISVSISIQLPLNIGISISICMGGMTAGIFIISNIITRDICDGNNIHIITIHAHTLA